MWTTGQSMRVPIYLCMALSVLAVDPPAAHAQSTGFSSRFPVGTLDPAAAARLFQRPTRPVTGDARSIAGCHRDQSTAGCQVLAERDTRGLLDVFVFNVPVTAFARQRG
jgi:hypothetical protein